MLMTKMDTPFTAAMIGLGIGFVMVFAMLVAAWG